MWACTRDQNTGNDVDGDVCWATSQDGGETWSSAFVLTHPDTKFDQDSRPFLAGDASGNYIAAWIHRGTKILTSTLLADSDEWTPFVEITDESLNNPLAIAEAGGTWIVAWGSGTGRIAASRSTDLGETWSTPNSVDPEIQEVPVGGNSPALAGSDVFGWVLVWRSSSELGQDLGTDWDLIAASSVDGATWSFPEPIDGAFANDSANDRDPSVAIAPTGHRIVVWSAPAAMSVRGASGTDLFSTTWDPLTSLWSARREVDQTADGKSDERPYVRYGEDGVAVLVWEHGARDVQVVGSSDNGASWSTAAYLRKEELPVSSAFGSDSFPVVAVDRVGSWFACWSTTDNLNGTIGLDSDVVGVRGSFCGDNILEGPEACDNDDIHCCSETCEATMVGGFCAEDGNECTAEACDGFGFCQSTSISGACDDGDMCTAGDRCVGGNCVQGASRNCRDDDPCTADECHPVFGCLHSPRVDCDPGDFCGDADESGAIFATDALFALQTAVEAATCPLSLCDVDNSEDITASDALRILLVSVDIPIELDCPAPQGTVVD